MAGKVLKKVKCCLYAICIGLLLVIIHLFLLLSGTYLSIAGPFVVKSSLGDYYDEKFIIYDYRKVESTIIGISRIDYYVHPKNNEDIKLLISYSGGLKLSPSKICCYRLTLEQNKFYDTLRKACVGASECIEKLDFVYGNFPKLVEGTNAGLVSVWNDVDGFTAAFEMDIKYPADYDKEVAFTELFTGLRESGVEFSGNRFYINLYLGDDLYNIESRLSLSEISYTAFKDEFSDVENLPLGYNVRVSLDDFTYYNGDILLENFDSFVGESSN